MNKIQLIEEQILGCLLLDGGRLFYANEDELMKMAWKFDKHGKIFESILDCYEVFMRIEPTIVFTLQVGEDFSLAELFEMANGCNCSAFVDYMKLHKMLLEHAK